MAEDEYGSAAGDEATLSRLTLRNFRSVKEQSVELDNPTYLVGQNGTGKSNFVDAISFIAEAMSSPLSAVLRRRGGFTKVAHRHANGHSTEIGFNLKLRDLGPAYASAEYDLVLRGRPDHRLEVVSERCFVDDPRFPAGYSRKKTSDDEDGMRWDGEVDPPKLSHSTLALPMVGDSRLSPMFNFLSDMRTYRIDPAQLRQDHDSHGDWELNADGGNVASVLHRISYASRYDFEDICELLARAVPGVVRVDAVERQGELALEFLLNLSDGEGRFDAANMSEGTLRMLGILVATHQNPPPALLVIEEPEASIHPGALGIVLDVLRAARHRSQVVVTTHSPEVLDAKWIKDNHLRLVSWEDGATRVDPVSQSVRTAMQEHLFHAGELLRSNALDRA